jgi:hypothetical protein
MVLVSISSAKSEDATNQLGYHEFFVRANDAERNPAGRCGNHALIYCVSLFFEFDSKEFQPSANPGADRGRILADATSEDERVQPAQRRRECADPFLDLVAKQRDRFSRPYVVRFTQSSPKTVDLCIARIVEYCSKRKRARKGSL